MKVCVICKREFEPHKPLARKQKTCGSHECHKANMRRHDRLRRKLDKKEESISTEKRLTGRTVPHDELERCADLMRLLDVPSKLLTEFEQGMIWALTQLESVVDKKVREILGRVT